MSDIIKKVLEFDPLGETEKLFGDKHWSEFSEDENKLSMGLFFMHNKNKDKLLKESKDTHFSMDWDEFIEILTSNQFKLGYKYSFPYEDKTEKAVIYYNSDGLVIWATSYWNGKSVNGGTLYGEIKMHDVSDRSNIPSCSNGFYDFKNGKLNFSTDIREGLIWFISQMNKYGTFLNEWEDENKFLWFVDFVEDDVPGYDYEKLTRNKIHQCCDEAKNIMKRLI